MPKGKWISQRERCSGFSSPKFRYGTRTFQISKGPKDSCPLHLAQFTRYLHNNSASLLSKISIFEMLKARRSF